MGASYIGLSVAKTFDEIRAVLEGWFPSLQVGDFDRLIEDPAQEWPPIVMHVWATASEFPTVVDFDLFPGPQDQPYVKSVTIELARRFCRTFSCRTICDGTGYGDSQAPYWSLIFDSEETYLADDCNSLLVDGTGGPVKIVRPIPVPKTVLDDRGLLVVEGPHAD